MTPSLHHAIAQLDIAYTALLEASIDVPAMKPETARACGAVVALVACLKLCVQSDAEKGNQDVPLSS
jgi:hypothetical protein